MKITSMGEFADAAGMHQTWEKKNHAGEPVFGILAPAAHVRFFTADENADKIARIGIDERLTIGTFVGERYSSDVLAQVINHASNPFGFDASVLPYTPTQEDNLDCKTVRGLWDLVLDTSAKLSAGGGTTPSPEDPRLPKLLALQAAVESITSAAEKVPLPSGPGGVPARGLRAARTALRAALNAAK